MKKTKHPWRKGLFVPCPEGCTGKDTALTFIIQSQISIATRLCPMFLLKAGACCGEPHWRGQCEHIDVLIVPLSFKASNGQCVFREQSLQALWRSPNDFVLQTQISCLGKPITLLPSIYSGRSQDVNVHRYLDNLLSIDKMTDRFPAPRFCLKDVFLQQGCSQSSSQRVTMLSTKLCTARTWAGAEWFYSC